MGIVELSSSSFGQSFQVTPIQMVTAISAIANGGKLMKPYLISKQLDENGNVTEIHCTADLETKNNMPADGRMPAVDVEITATTDFGKLLELEEEYVKKMCENIGI